MHDWKHGRMHGGIDVWMHGRMHDLRHEQMHAWAHGRTLGAWTHARLEAWTNARVGTRTQVGRMDACVPRMDRCDRGLCGTCMHGRDHTRAWTIPHQRSTAPTQLGNDVSVGAGVSILGNIVVGSGAKIGAGSVVLREVPPGATMVGIPARQVVHKVQSDADMSTDDSSSSSRLTPLE